MDPDAVVTDIIMPEFGILEAMPELRRAHHNLKVIAISGNPHLLTLAKPERMCKL